MNGLSPDERKALDLMQKENFRGVSKDNVMQLMSILDKVDPEVAKAIIAQMPVVVKGIVENEKEYVEILNKGIESCNESSKSCYQTEDMIIQSLKNEVDKEGTTLRRNNIIMTEWQKQHREKKGKIRSIGI